MINPENNKNHEECADQTAIETYKFDKHKKRSKKENSKDNLQI